MEGLDENEKAIEVARQLTGLNSSDAWNLRERLLNEDIKDANDRYQLYATLAQSLGGLDSEQAWEMREKLMALGVKRAGILRGLTAIDSPRAWEFRIAEIFNKNYRDVLASIAGIDTPAAWGIREACLVELDEDPELNMDAFARAGVYGDVSRSLIGLSSDRAWKLREQLIPRSKDVGLSLAGLDDQRAWEMRERLLKEGGLDSRVLAGLVGVRNPKAWKLRAEHLHMAKGPRSASPSAVAGSVAGMDDMRAWGVRDWLAANGHGYSILGTIGGGGGSNGGIYLAVQAARNA